MSYIINNSRGNIIAIVADGTVNITATDLSLVGRAVTDYGTYENENYIYLLENFANSTAPLLPILGQLWYNSDIDTISSYSTANTWVSLASQDYVQAQKNSPAFSGIPTAPTATINISTTQLATTEFVINQLSGANSIVSVGNITGGNILTSGLISATGNITGGNVLGGANVNAVTHTGTTVSVTGNITGGNVLGGANVNATTHTGTTVSVTGNITGGNILTSGMISATGNIITANTIIADTVIANTVIATGTTSAFRLPNLTQTQINALSAQNGDMVYNTTDNLPQVYQNGVWWDFTISFYS